MSAPIKIAMAMFSLATVASFIGYTVGYRQGMVAGFRPDPTGYVMCDFDGSVHAGNIHIIDGWKEEEFKDLLIHGCLMKRRVKAL